MFTDRLLITPAQFWGNNTRTGKLRRFSQMVFEVSYLDPQSATPETLDDTTPPEISDVSIQLPTAGVFRIASVGKVTISANVNDSSGSLKVDAAYSSDGVHWTHVLLQPNGGGNFTAQLDAPTGGKNISVIVSATDESGNVSTYTAKGSLLAYSYIYLPVTRR